MIDKARAISNMIYKECRRNSLVDLCEYWGVSTDDFDAFINAGEANFSTIHEQSAKISKEEA